MSVKLLAFAGSLRSGSLNKQLVKAAAQYAEEAGAEVTYIDLNDFDLPLYNQDLEKGNGLPEPVKKLKGLMKEHHGFLIATPEYNSALSGVLKNMIDWVSRREEGEEKLEVFTGKTACIMTASPGGLGGIRGLPILRLILSHVNVLVIPKQVAFGGAHEGFNDDGTIKNESAASRVQAMAQELVQVTTGLNK